MRPRFLQAWYNQSLVIWKNGFSRTSNRQVSRLAALNAVAFPISQWLLKRDSVDPHTVTRSHRLLTCFPFTR